ncbi:hypothetical protein DSL72_001179 [Monilinia vaccinii-corymbosi]|uniref:Uncharacterized protein n=1 Tax=Monilinia vaccinii-corymbosi TaxID=61207 RepID=A0A8A3P3C2_9HELO|nr:hypothetical protein DSL72_001179 [Monilinia vaccinii-corymbosi]
MHYQLHVWVEDKEHTIEGHTKQCTLFFKDKQVWGPVSCHDNTEQLRDAIKQADERFSLAIESKSKSTEGHTRKISVKSKGKVLLDGLSTHERMEGLAAAIEAILAVES